MRALYDFMRFVVLFCLLALTAVAQQPASIPPAQTAEVFGQKIRYYESGQGPVVILLHGMGANAERWALNIGPLSKEFHVYALDQIGFGHSDKPLMDYKVETFVDFLREFMRVVNLPKATLVGNSLGGWVAARLTIEHPELVERLVLADAAGMPPVSASKIPDEPKRRPPDFSFASLAATRTVLETVYHDKKLVTDDLVRRVFQSHLQTNDSFTIQRLVANQASEYLSADRLNAIRAPTLVVWGRQDELIPLVAGETYHNAIANSEMVIIDECGHLPQVEKPLQFNKAVLDFLAKNR